MNSIPIIFNERKVSHTIVGGSVKKSDDEGSPFTVILLNRGGRYYRSAVFQSLESAGFDSILSIESPPAPSSGSGAGASLVSQSYDIENLSIRFPSVRFLVPLENLTIGEMINAGMAETSSPWVLVLWNDMRLSQGALSQRLMSRIQEENLLCTAPVLTSQRMESLPVQMVPALKNKRFQIEPMPCIKDGSPTSYPFDFAGIYNRERFIRLGGFDHTISNPYWQNLDFGFRASLWGEQIRLSTSFRASYDGEVPQEDISSDRSYVRFYLKNLAPSFRKDEAVLPLVRFLSFLPRSGLGIFDAFSIFLQVRKWVHVNRYRFSRDAVEITRNWEPFIQ
ncbi:hypothetical protein K7J14_00650 [Treponema zuelzerae]|uniref:Glycosyltransferase n=1 Tax=Teretinema zuelzerae TaxID=156 RepID=A0AAE3JH48_9SPIR|nr:hypothetical protein [Teretinema zuelzerae]MCD1653217.1 hypothetical protein [Teretinema zuelzerae]